MFACLGIIMSLVQGGYIRRAMVNNEIKIAKRSIIMLIVGFITVGLSTYRYVLYAGLIPFAFAAASVVPCLSSAVSKYGNKSQKGRLMGTVRKVFYWPQIKRDRLTAWTCLIRDNMCPKARTTHLNLSAGSGPFVDHLRFSRRFFSKPTELQNQELIENS